MCKRAMQQGDTNVNKSVDFIEDKCSLTPLFLGHKPISVMIDTRSKAYFEAILANKD